MTDIVVVDAVRSAVGRAKKGSLANRRPDELAGEVVRGLLARNPEVKPEMVEDFILGCAFPEGEQGMNVARMVGVLGGLPEETSAMTINRFCSSGLQAIALGAGAIAAGYNDVVIAGGVESMTMVPLTGNTPSATPAVRAEQPDTFTPLGITAENVANKFGISRDQQDAFAVRSHEKAIAAIEKGAFENEIVPVHGVRFDSNGERALFGFKVDELPRPGTNVEGLAKLRPAFAMNGSVTAGNSSPLSDGAAAAIIMSAEKANELGVTPLAYFRSFATVGVDPSI
ncbi:MAG: thiolase family protein, partial [Deltaproteobacteria bacterium]|nr:thiolase family protein [Deltaproteobacteria bacterium]